MRAPLFLFAAMALTLGLGRAELPEAARGLAIYKSRAFSPDSSAELIEYRSQKSFEAVTYFIAVKGHRITVPTGKAEVLFLPYPGKGEATPEQALALLGIAQQRFPQFHPHYLLYAHVWRREAKRPAEVIAAEVAQRQKNEVAATDFASWIKSILPKHDPPKLPPNLLGPTVLNPAPSPVAAPTAGSTEKSPGLEGDLKKIQEFYHLSGQLNGD